MSIQMVQLITFIIYLVMGVATFNLIGSKKYYLAAFVAGLAFVVFALSPVKTKQEGMAKVERVYVVDEVIPERVTIKDKSFEEFHKDSLNLMKKTSEGLKNEIHN